MEYRAYHGLHGQSIKTRVEAENQDLAVDLYGVYTDNPLKQGLKPANGLYYYQLYRSTRTIH